MGAAGADSGDTDAGKAGTTGEANVDEDTAGEASLAPTDCSMVTYFFAGFFPPEGRVFPRRPHLF